MKGIKQVLWFAVTMMVVSLTAQAQTKPPAIPDAAASNPKDLGWMQGFPPPPEKTIRFDNGSYYRFPALRWSFSHIRELNPTKNIWRGEGPVSVLPRAERPLDDLTFTDMTGKTMTWAQSLARNYTDGILVLHQGKVIYEKYFGALEPRFPHSAFSITKSIVGTLATLQVIEGKLDPAALVTKYLPEMKGTAYEDATVRQVMDMTVGVQYSEDYANPKAEVFDYARAGGMLPFGPNYQGPRTFYEFLVKLKKEGRHGEAFAYKTVNSEILAWIIKRVSGKSLADLFSEVVWSKLGAENDAYFQVDSVGTESGGGGLNTCLRDLARFGEMIRLKGFFNGRQIIPTAVIEDIRKGADKTHFAKAGYPTLPGWSYRNMWWIAHNEHGAFMARGIHGQNIYIDPNAEMVIVRYASNPIAGNVANDPFTLPAYMAVAKILMP
jgi:CubicO group peptidase (beta-lactamase class C family)